MFQITPILADNLSPVIANVVPIVAQNLASKNSEIQDLASNILDVFIEYIGNELQLHTSTTLSNPTNHCSSSRRQPADPAVHQPSHACQHPHQATAGVQAGRPDRLHVPAQAEAGGAARTAVRVGAPGQCQGQQWQRADGGVRSPSAEFVRAYGRESGGEGGR